MGKWEAELAVFSLDRVSLWKASVSTLEDPGMIRKTYPWVMFLVGIWLGITLSNRLVIYAQAQRKSVAAARSEFPAKESDPEPKLGVSPTPLDEDPVDRPAVSAPSQTVSVYDHLVRPYHFPFSRPTSLRQVCSHLKQTLKIPVVLDIAALGRQGIEPEDTVQLELDGVRLKTGLKLLLDQVKLTYHVVGEDNLLIITDRDGSEEPLDRVWTELQAMHRELHDVRDTIDDLTDAIAIENGEGARVRKPTIIEEMPEVNAQSKKDGAGEKPEDSLKNPKGAVIPNPQPRSNSSRVPLVGPGRPL